MRYYISTIKIPCEMRKKIFVWIALIGIGLIVSCNNKSLSNEKTGILDENLVLQQNDGTISLNIAKADCYHDKANPSSNTAEWSVVVSKSGRYDVWLSSATTDTTNLRYDNSVLLSIRDNRLETIPIVNRVVHSSSEVMSPYYRADSFMGSLYIQDTGVYNIQVISDKVLPVDFRSSDSAAPEGQTKILAVSLKPVKH